MHRFRLDGASEENHIFCLSETMHWGICPIFTNCWGIKASQLIWIYFSVLLLAS